FEGDEVWLRRALGNLVINAREAMPDGGTLTLVAGLETLSPQEAAALDVQPGRYVSLVVRDTGIGIPPEHMAHLFEPFFTTKKRLGAGLGLAAVYGIVRQHRGAIRVESCLGQGSAFHVYFPLVELSDERPDGDDSQASGPA
ncbi:MAG: hypothetical protein H5T69_09215, partial [Chloroflexi bacterium]|nr:hypothetical protein [Chloroflexota bacterium]